MSMTLPPNLHQTDLSKSKRHKRRLGCQHHHMDDSSPRSSYSSLQNSFFHLWESRDIQKLDFAMEEKVLTWEVQELWCCLVGRTCWIRLPVTAKPLLENFSRQSTCQCRQDSSCLVEHACGDEAQRVIIVRALFVQGPFFYNICCRVSDKVAAS